MCWEWFAALLDAIITVMAALVCRKRKSTLGGDTLDKQSIASVTTALELDVARRVGSSVFQEADCQLTPCLAQYISSVGWLFAPHKALHLAPQQTHHLVTDLSEESTQEEPIVPMLAVDRIPTTFQSLPTEIHFRIAAYLPGHAIIIIVGSDKFSESLRQIYKTADPGGRKNELYHLSFKDFSIYRELYSRDLFEATLSPRVVEGLGQLARDIWSASRFYCTCCKALVGPTHFPMKEMLESVNNRTGLSKITNRLCSAQVTPVQLWGNRAISWDQLQEAQGLLRQPDRSVTVLWDFHIQSPWLLAGKTKLYMSPADTLTLDYVFPSKLEATAKYFIDLCTPLRFRSANASTITHLVQQNCPYICPHLDLATLFGRNMASRPIDCRPETGSHNPKLTVAQVLVQALDQKPWSPDPDSPHRRLDRPLRKVKEQAVWCGFKTGPCRSSVTLQRFRDNERWSVGWMRDLVRLKVVRKWRVDRGTGDGEWQAQNGVNGMVESVSEKE